MTDYKFSKLSIREDWYEEMKKAANFKFEKWYPLKVEFERKPVGLIKFLEDGSYQAKFSDEYAKKLIDFIDSNVVLIAPGISKKGKKPELMELSLVCI